MPKRNKVYLMNVRTLTRYRNKDRDYCWICGVRININEAVFSRYAGNNKRYSLLYHEDCAKKVQLI